jgi:hypothetical protein
MRETPRSTVAMLGFLIGLVAALGLLAWHHHVDNRDPIKKEINDLIATLQTPVEIETRIETAPARRRGGAWPAAAAGAGVVLIVFALRAWHRTQQRSRNNVS